MVECKWRARNSQLTTHTNRSTVFPFKYNLIIKSMLYPLKLEQFKKKIEGKSHCLESHNNIDSLIDARSWIQLRLFQSFIVYFNRIIRRSIYIKTFNHFVCFVFLNLRFLIIFVLINFRLVSIENLSLIKLHI